MPTASKTLQVKGLGQRAMNQLATKARRLGTTPERYVRDLVTEDLALDRRAQMTSFAEIVGPGREVDEAELDRLVEAARVQHHRQSARKK